MLNWIFVGLNIFVAVTMAATSALPAKPHKNVILETTLPHNALQQPPILALTQQYKKQLWGLAIFFSLAGLPIMFIHFDSLALLYFTLLLFGLIGTFYGTEIHFIHKMNQLKRHQGWGIPITTEKMVDTQLILTKNRRLVPISWFGGSGILLLVGLFSNWRVLGWTTSWPLILALSLSWLLFLLLYWVIAALPVRVLTAQPEHDRLLNDAYRQTWSRQMVISSYVLGILPLVVTLTTIIFSVMYLYLVLITGFCVYFIYDLIRERNFEDQLLGDFSLTTTTDEDRYWRYAMYNNPNDRRLFVPDRVGVNISLNLGRPAGKLIGGAILVLVLGLLFSVIGGLLALDFGGNSIRASATTQAITLKAPGTRTSQIKRQEVTQVRLMRRLPANTVRANGIGTAHFAIGNFRVQKRSAKLYVARDTGAVLRLRTKQRDYYFSAKKPQETRRLYRALH
ncbi:PH domain-containing protein [Loigolactobacillus zhaoyuanensis]|uniref:PH domain-containing protein n=1 Tax=Loigolactobacillus zhaoyuanensis TaxID=2486017 RepID=A0ABW8U9X2_9LACO|nr:PH domain-containing protein [Loigolactobacillus zhaoyuanensis]